MIEQLSFRTFQEQDGPDIEQMVAGLYADDPSPVGMSLEKVRRTIDELLRRPEKGAFVVFESGDAIIGYALIVHFWSNEYGGTIEVIDELYVQPDWRGRGVASAFLEYIVDTSQADVKGLHLEVTPRNVRARALYARHGFRATRNKHMSRTLDR